MRYFVLLYLGATVWIGASVQPASAVHRQVFLLGGQSNMVGLGTNVSSPPLAFALPEVRFYYGYPNVSALPEDTWVDLAPGSGNTFGPELSFGHAIHALDPGGNYALIKHARGGSDVNEDWNPEVENNVYAAFRSSVADALQALSDDGDTYEIVGMLWTQGIRDGREGRSALQFQEDLEDLIADLRLNYGADLPVLISRLSIHQTVASVAADGFTVPSCRISRETPECPDDPALPGFGLNGVRTGQEAVAANDPLSYLIDTDAFEIAGDNSHLNTLGQIALGEAFADAYFQNVVVPEPNTVVLSFWTLLLLGERRQRHAA